MAGSTDLLDATITLIQRLHAEQIDWQGNPYWHHPVGVMNLLPPDSPLERKLIALLHDVIEDTETDAGFLRRQGYSEHVVRGVELLTRKEGDGPYLDKIRAIIDSGHVDAMWVKLADNEHNTSEARYAALPPEKRDQALRLRDRYEASKVLLREALERRAQEQG